MIGYIVLAVLLAYLFILMIRMQWRVTHQDRDMWDKDPFE